MNKSAGPPACVRRPEAVADAAIAASRAFMPALLIALAMGRSIVARAEGPTLPDSVRAALEANARGLDGLRIEGTKSRRLLGPSEATLAALGTLEDEAEFTQPVRFELRLGGARVYEGLRFPAGKYKPSNGVDERSFDGLKYFNGSIDRSQSNPTGSLMIRYPVGITAREKPFELWYLGESGFLGPVATADVGRPVGSLPLSRIAAGKLESVAQAAGEPDGVLDLTVSYPDPWAGPAGGAATGKGDATQQLRGDTQQLQERVERDRRELRGRRWISRFRLDPALSYAVRERRDSREDGALLFDAVASDFRRVDPSGPWLPWRLDIASHAYETKPGESSVKPLYSSQIVLTAVERAELSDAQFRIWYDHIGIFVSDSTSPKATPERPDSYLTTTGKPLSEAGWSWGWKLFLAGNTALVLAVAAVLLIRLRRKSLA